MGKVLELLKSAKDNKELKEMLEECRLLSDDLTIEPRQDGGLLQNPVLSDSEGRPR